MIIDSQLQLDIFQWIQMTNQPTIFIIIKYYLYNNFIL